ncbi:DUF3592 domain-containing protein [Kitasatospora sp. NPDC058170]|uniref:DUF3592 domain-containing protein n=1 Tax=Kitasatospora sp. NPDC058170 TaxID=3346364 RepID=UPI0036D7B304
MGRLLMLLVCAALLAADGWATGRGYAALGRAGDCGDTGQRVCGSIDLWHGLAASGGTIVGMVLLIGTAFVLAADGTASASSDLPIGAGTLAGVLCLLLGVARGADTTSGWLLGPAAVVALLALWSARAEARRRRRILAEERRRAERELRLERHGVSVPATVLDIRGTGVHLNDCPELVVTLRYTTDDGQEYTESVTETFPAYDAPRRGDVLTVRYDPDLPDLPQLRADTGAGAGTGTGTGTGTDTDTG